MDKKQIRTKFAPPKNSEKLLSYIIKYNKQFIFTAISGTLYNTIIVLGPIFQGKLLDSAISSSSVWGIVKSGIEFILITLAFQVARFFKRYYVRDMANRISGDMRIGITESLLNKDLNTLEKQRVGDMMSTTIGDVDIVVEAVRKTITELWDTWVLMLAYFVALMIYDVKITLIASIPIPLSIFLAEFMKNFVQSKNKLARKANSKTTSQIRKMIAETSLLRLYGREEAELERLEEKLKDQSNKATIASVLKSGLGPIYSSLATIGIILVVALGSNEVIMGNWTIGTFTAFITMFTSLAARTTTAAKVFNVQQGAKASWERVKNLMEKNNIEYDFKDEILNPKEISIEKLSFKYPTSNQYAIEDLSLKVKEGMIIGVTGSVGSGKSALGLVLTGLYDYEGSIKFDGMELRDISSKDKCSGISYMGHNPFLFSESFRNNITWGVEEEDRLEKALDIASLKEDIKRLDHGLDTQVGEKGIKVSGGQKQRIALARALYKNSKIVILDDPFSAVDINTEAKIIEGLRKNVEDKIIFIFSHRLDAFKHTDKVLVLDKGKVVQQGTHEELVNVIGIYRKIVESQKFLGGGEGEEE
ncbi:MAG: ABC transporter ATP-binding protein [Clostridiaceae bacterium]